MEGFEEDEWNDEQSSRINLKTENTNNYIEDPGRQDFNFSDSPDNNPFWIDSYDDNKQGTTRMSGNEKSLLHTMTHGDIRQEILDEVRRGVIDVQDSKEWNQNTTQGIIDNLEDIDWRDDENTFEYKKSSTMDECNATREKAHRDDSGTTDNYFFGFTDSMQIQNRDMWDGEFLSRETVHNVKISSGIWVPFKDNNSYKNKEKMVYIQDNSPKDSDISADSFDSVKRINKEIDNDQTNNLSARFFEKVNQVRSNRAQQESLKKNMKNNKTGMFNNSSISSLLVSNTMNLPTILEQEENMKVINTNTKLFN